MRRNGSRKISFEQYRLTDLFIFAAVLAAFELILHFAFKAFEGNGAFFTFSPLVPVVLLVMMRWGWVSVFYAVGDGALFCLLNGAGWQSYIIYCAGNAFVMFLLFYMRFVGKERIRKSVYLSLLMVVIGWVLIVLGRAIIAVCTGMNFLDALSGQLWELISLAVGLLLIAVMRKLDGIFEDQKHYLLRMEEERLEKQRRDEFGDEPIELDEDTLSILNKRDDEWQ